MDRRSACLATAALYRRHAELEPARRAFLLAEADKWAARAELRLQLCLQIETEDRPTHTERQERRRVA